MSSHIDGNGGEGLATSNVKPDFIVPLAQSTQLSLCSNAAHRQRARAARDVAREPSVANHFCFFSIWPKRLKNFFAGKPGAIIWLLLGCTIASGYI
jgi:hypothetical protein